MKSSNILLLLAFSGALLGAAPAPPKPITALVYDFKNRLTEDRLAALIKQIKGMNRKQLIAVSTFKIVCGRDEPNLDDLFPVLEKLSALRRLEIDDCYIKPTTAETFAKDLPAHLEVLILNDTSIGDPGTSALLSQHKLMYVRVLELPTDRMTDASIDALLDNFPSHLQRLDMSYNQFNEEGKKRMDEFAVTKPHVVFVH